MLGMEVDANRRGTVRDRDDEGEDERDLFSPPGGAAGISNAPTPPAMSSEAMAIVNAIIIMEIPIISHFMLAVRHGLFL